MGSNSDFTISAMLDKIMEDEEKKSKKKQKDIENKKKKENHGNSKEQIQSIPAYYRQSMGGNFPAYPNHSETHLKQTHSVPANINPPHPLPPNGSVPPQFHPIYSRPPPMPIHNEIPIPNANLVGSNSSYPSNTVIPPIEFFPPPPINHNPEMYGSTPINMTSNIPHQNFQTFPEPNTNLPFPIVSTNPSNFSMNYNSRNPTIENDSYDHVRKKVKTNSLSHSSITATLPPPPSPPKLDTYTSSKGITSHSVHSPKRPYTPPNRQVREFTPKRKFNSETKSSKRPRSPKHSVDKPTRHTSYNRRKSSEPYFKPYEKKIYDDRKSSRYDRRDRRENSYERKNKSEKDDKERRHHSESSYRYDKYGHSQGQKRSRSREADHRSVNKYKHRQSFNELIPKEEAPFNSSGPPSSFNSFNECPPFNPAIPSPFNPVKQETSYPVVEGMPFPPPGLNFTPKKNDLQFNNSDLRPFDPPPPLEILPFTPEPRPPPFNHIQDGPLNVIPVHPPYNVNESSLIPIETQPFNNNFKENNSNLKDCASKSSKSSRSHKFDKRKRKPHTNLEGGVEFENGSSKKLEQKRKKEGKKESKMSKISKDYELEPGECVSDSLSDIDSSSSSDENSDSEISSSSSSDTEDSIYKLDFLKNKKSKTTRFDISDKEPVEDNTVIKSAEKPKFPRYFKDRVAYCDDTSITNLSGPNEENPLIEQSSSPLTKIEESKTPVSPSLVSESLKATRTPLIKRLGLAQNGEEYSKDDDYDDYDSVTDEANLMVHTERENVEDCQLSSVKENVPDARESGDISPFTFEQYMQRSSSLSPNNSLDFEEYKLLVSTKEILSASKSIFKSPTSPKSTATKKKYEKPIIKVETASKPTHYKDIKESPQRIDLDSRIRLMFGMKSSCDNSPEKKNFRNAAFSYKSMRLLSRPPSPFRNKGAYQFWHRETYYFRKNNPIPDIFSDPTQKRKFGTHSKSKGSKTKIPRFPNLKEDYYQSREIEPRLPTKTEKDKNKNTKENQEEDSINISSVDVGVDHHLNISNQTGTNDTTEAQKKNIRTEDHEEETPSKPNKVGMLDSITKINVSPDSELELVSENYEDKVEMEKANIPIEKYDTSSNNFVKLILSRIVEELRNEIKSKLTEEIIEETIKMRNNEKDTIDKNEDKDRNKGRKRDLRQNQQEKDFLIFKKPKEKL